MSDNARYRFGPLERRGLVFGLRAGQAGLLVGSAGVTLIMLHIATNFVTIFFALTFLAGAVFASFWRISGQTLEQWGPLALSFMWRRARKDHVFITTAPLIGRTRTADSSTSLPPTLQGLTLLAAPVTGGELGVLKDAKEDTYTAVVSVRGRSFALLDQDAKVRLLELYADVLGGMAREGSPIRRVQWIERTVPDPGDGIGQYLRESIALPHTSPAVRSYLQLVEDAGPTTQQHEALLAIQVSATKAARAIRQAGGKDEGACSVLAREIYALASRLAAADLDVVGMLTPRLLAQAFRVAFDPASREVIALRNLDDPAATGVAPSQAWPTATEANWAYYRTDSGFHVTYWVSEWPRTDVGPDFLAPLILQTWVQRTIAVTIEPVPAMRAQREAEAARTTDIADAELRRKHGFMTTMRKQREHESVARREEELADGHADIRFSGYITVTAENLDQLELSCGEIEQQAAQSRLVLRRLSGEQDVAFTYTLPLGRGLR